MASISGFGNFHAYREAREVLHTEPRAVNGILSLLYPPFSQVFGMTASPTVECVEVLQSKAYVCEDDLIEDYQANAQWELLFYKVRCLASAPVWISMLLCPFPLRQLS